MSISEAGEEKYDQFLLDMDDEAMAYPTYRVFDLYAPHKGNNALTTTVDTSSRKVGPRTTTYRSSARPRPWPTTARST